MRKSFGQNNDSKKKTVELMVGKTVEVKEVGLMVKTPALLGLMLLTPCHITEISTAKHHYSTAFRS